MHHLKASSFITLLEKKIILMKHIIFKLMLIIIRRAYYLVFNTDHLRI